MDFAKEFYHVDMIKSMGKEIFERIIMAMGKEKDTVSNQKRQTSFFTWRKTVPTLPTEFPSTRLCMK